MAATSLQLTSLCAIASFLWLAHNLEHHQLIEYPRLSSWLILLISGVASYVASFFSLWLPGANGRFDDDHSALEVGQVQLPKRPRRFYILIVVALVVQRLEMFHKTTLNLQCSKPGVEAFLPLVVLVYELLPGRRTRVGVKSEEEIDEMNESNFDYVRDLARESGVFLVLGTVLLSWGSYVASSQAQRSTFFCSSLLDDPVSLAASQWLGVVIDGVILVLLWRILAWARTTKGRLRTLSGILLSSAVATSVMYAVLGQVYHYQPMSYSFRGLDSLFIFDLVVDGLVFSVFFMSSGLLICETTPLNLAAILASIAGLVAACRQISDIGTWESVSAGTLRSVFLLTVGLSVFAYANGLRSVVFIRRALLVLLLGIFLLTTFIMTLARGQGVVHPHPLSRVIYDARIKHDRWLVQASSSRSLRVAVQVYQERHQGRAPPPGFDIWYRFATEHNSPILDHFPQIDDDLLPFRGLTPAKLRQGVSRALSEPDVVALEVVDGQAKHNAPDDSPHLATIQALMELLVPIAKDLPNVVLPINMDARPRVLVPWDDLRKAKDAARRQGLPKLLPRRPAETPALQTPSGGSNYTSVKAFREMTALTCPHNAPARSGVYWDVRDVCTACARPQSDGLFLTNWDTAQDVCHQPDLLRLHSFYMTPPTVRPLQDLIPMFSRAKTSSYADILIPLPQVDEKTDLETGSPEMKWKKLYWRQPMARDAADLTPEVWRGGHRERLVHLLNNSTDQTTILLPTGQEDRFRHESIPTAALNRALLTDVAFSGFAPCDTSPSTPSENPACAQLLAEFGAAPPATELGSLYNLVVDDDTGPSADLAHILRSGAVPLVASVFRAWHSERLAPWLHFVPVDVRWHALHGTLAYFTGLRGDGTGRAGGDAAMGNRHGDAVWIAEQGRRWAGKALRGEDMMVYLFRLILEWARLVDERRDELGFVYVDE